MASGTCCYCGRDGNVTIEHLTPISRGGRDTFANIRAACYQCNQLKGNMRVEEFRSTLTAALYSRFPNGRASTSKVAVKWAKLAHRLSNDGRITFAMEAPGA